MIHYHGTPCGGRREDVARFLSGRHALIPFGRSEDIGTAAEVCHTCPAPLVASVMRWPRK